MSQAPAIVAVIKIRIDDAWDSRIMAFFGSPQNFAEDLCERLKDKAMCDEASVMSVEVVKPT